MVILTLVLDNDLLHGDFVSNIKLNDGGPKFGQALNLLLRSDCGKVPRILETLIFTRYKVCENRATAANAQWEETRYGDVRGDLHEARGAGDENILSHVR